MLSYKSGFKSLSNAAKIESNSRFTFSDYTTYKLGGGAAEAYFPKSLYQLKAVYDFLESRNMQIAVVGNGSNILASNKKFEGGVIVTKYLKGIISLGNGRLMCLAGTRISDLINYSKSRNLTGIEFMYGIPATVGGAAFMNAGVGLQGFGDRISSVKVYNGNIVNLDHKNCNFSYKQSTMRDINALILSIIVNLDYADKSVIEDKISYYKRRREHLPKGRSCGCVFKNPNGVSAGLLIDGANLKGLRFGNAFVSERHANFIINNGSDPNDVKALIDIVKARVFKVFGILLQEEVVYIGEFNDFNG